MWYVEILQTRANGKERGFRYHASLHYISAQFISSNNLVCQVGTRHGRIAHTRTAFTSTTKNAL